MSFKTELVKHLLGSVAEGFGNTLGTILAAKLFGAADEDENEEKDEKNTPEPTD